MVGQNGHIGQGVADLILSPLSDRISIMKERINKMDKLDYALSQIRSCDICEGKGNLYYGNGDEYDFETCICNTYDLILDDNGDVIYDNGLLSEPELLASWEAR
jgi:hypothetical protein